MDTSDSSASFGKKQKQNRLTANGPILTYTIYTYAKRAVQSYAVKRSIRKKESTSAKKHTKCSQIGHNSRLRVLSSQASVCLWIQRAFHMCFITAFIGIKTLTFHQVWTFVPFTAQTFRNKEPFSVSLRVFGQLLVLSCIMGCSLDTLVMGKYFWGLA